MQAGLTFSVKAGENAKTEIISLEEGHFENGEWKAGRILNGDEKMSIRLGEMPSCFMIRLFRY